MKNPSIDKSTIDRLSAPLLFRQFCEAFGEPDHVAQEIEEFWQAGGSPFPQDVYAHLVEKRMGREISPERGQFLIDYFNESFAPERATGYADKHREPLVAAFSEMYARGGQRPIFRVEADIMNLGGLNRIITGKKGEKSHLADGVIRVMAGILHEELEKCGNVSAIRHGGDEFCLYVTAENKKSVEAALERAHSTIAIFMDAAKLSNVNHEKLGKMPGVGIGAAAIALHGQPKLKQHKELQLAIKAAKDNFLSTHMGATAQHAEVNYEAPGALKAHIKQLLESDTYKKYLTPSINDAVSVLKNRGPLDTDPDVDRLAKLAAELGGEPPEATLKLLEATHKFTAKHDPETGLGLFKNMRREMLPHFLAKPQNNGSIAQLVHFDFNNVGGGNELGYWVGNAMRSTFAECIKEALHENGHGAYTPYLAAQDGGKFALLLPATISRREITRLSTTVEMKLAEHARKKIDLAADEFSESLELMEGKADYQEIIANIHHQSKLTIGDILSVKAPHFKGAHVMVASALFDASKPFTNLGKIMRGLETSVAEQHGRKDSLIAQRRETNYIANIAVEGKKHGNRRNWRSQVLDQQQGSEPTR